MFGEQGILPGDLWYIDTAGFPNRLKSPLGDIHSLYHM